MITITVTRKPLSEATVSANVLKHGCGAINIDQSRIGVGVDTWPATRSQPKDRINLYTRKMSGDTVAVTVSAGQPPSGRWPTNLILAADEAITEMFPESNRWFNSPRVGNGHSKGEIFGQHTGTGMGEGDSGSASRFFKKVGCPQ